MLKKGITFQQYKGLFSQGRSLKNLLPELSTSDRLGNLTSSMVIPCASAYQARKGEDKTLKVKMGKT